MVYKVVSTKLTEDEHTKFLDFCNKKGISPFAFIKESIFNQIEKQEQEETKSKENEIDLGKLLKHIEKNTKN